MFKHTVPIQLWLAQSNQFQELVVLDAVLCKMCKIPLL